MADAESVHLLSFNFGSRTFAHKRLAQKLIRSLSAFTSVVREYSDLLVEADRSAQYVGNIGVAAHTAAELIEAIDHVFKQIKRGGLKLSPEKCQFC